MTLLERLRSLLLEHGRTVALAESCTGGMVCDLITDVPGSSEYFLGGVIAYSNESKINILGVDKATISEFGAVSEECALEMAKGVMSLFGSDIGMAITGIAGPGGGTENKPVGLVYLAYCDEDTIIVEQAVFPGERRDVKNEAARHCIGMLIEIIEGYDGEV